MDRIFFEIFPALDKVLEREKECIKLTGVHPTAGAALRDEPGSGKRVFLVSDDDEFVRELLPGESPRILIVRMRRRERRRLRYIAVYEPAHIVRIHIVERKLKFNSLERIIEGMRNVASHFLYNFAFAS